MLRSYNSAKIWSRIVELVVSPFPPEYFLQCDMSRDDRNRFRKFIEFELRIVDFEKRLEEAKEKARAIAIVSLPEIPPLIVPGSKTKRAKKSEAAARNMA